jgi:hypothetical protein
MIRDRQLLAGRHERRIADRFAPGGIAATNAQPAPTRLMRSRGALVVAGSLASGPRPTRPLDARGAFSKLVGYADSICAQNRLSRPFSPSSA